VGNLVVVLDNIFWKRSVGAFTAGIFGGVLAVIVVGAVVFELASVASRNEATVQQASRVKDYTRALQDCAVDARQFVQKDFSAFKQVWTACANQIYMVDLMEDFDIRREKLLRRELDERVILWMVVAITMSGVFLAGLQLLGSYKLATIGVSKFDEITNISVEAGKEANKFSIQSSVTGLMILVVSLVFFHCVCKMDLCGPGDKHR
jgi:hypothetical protein